MQAMQEDVSRNISRNSYEGPTTMDPCDQDALAPSNFSHVCTLTLAMSLWVCCPVTPQDSPRFLHFFTGKVAKHWNRLPEEVGELLSLSRKSYICGA